MLDCWQQNPALRPSFSYLMKSLDGMLELMATEVGKTGRRCDIYFKCDSVKEKSVACEKS